MKTKLMSIVLSCLMFEFCASAQREKTWIKDAYSEEYIKSTTRSIAQQTLIVPDLNYDQVWEICEQGLIRLGFRFYLADKNTGEIRVRGTGKDISNPGPRMTVLISKTDGQISVQVGLLVETLSEPLGEPSRDELVAAKLEVDRVIRQLKKDFKK